MLSELKIKTLFDAPCGDFQWLSTINLPIEKYFGVDVEPKHIKKLIEQYGEKKQFSIADICKDPLPLSDLILCRDCLVHFSFGDIYKAIDNFKQSAAKYLLTTTFTACNENIDIITGLWANKQ